jgi:hypothetical protein
MTVPGKQQMHECGQKAIPLLVCQALVIVLAGNPVSAAKPAKNSKPTNQTMQQVAKLYSAGKYTEAIAKIETLTPTAQSRYYSGLCYQSLNQVQKARDEFAWVYYYATDEKLKNNAEVALYTLQRYQQTRQYQGQGNNFARVSNTSYSGSAGAAPRSTGRT